MDVHSGNVDVHSTQEVEMPTITATTSIVVVQDEDRCTEANLMTDNTIQMYFEDGENCIDMVYTLEQAEALHRALGHLLYLANQEA